MTPRRIDRAALRARAPDLEGAVLEALVDALEPAVFAAEEKARARKKKAGQRRSKEARDLPAVEDGA